MSPKATRPKINSYEWEKMVDWDDRPEAHKSSFDADRIIGHAVKHIRALEAYVDELEAGLGDGAD